MIWLLNIRLLWAFQQNLDKMWENRDGARILFNMAGYYLKLLLSEERKMKFIFPHFAKLLIILEVIRTYFGVGK